MRILITLANILLGALTSYGQHFTLQDSTFKSGDVLICYNILFDFGKATLRPDNDVFLDSIVGFMTKHKNLTLEVSNHCDERWTDEYSYCITCNRAKAIADYLTSKEIKSERIVAKGYNDKKPLIVNAKTEEEHQKNRRTEFKILKTDYGE